MAKGKENRLLIAILIGIVLGVLVGGSFPAVGRAISLLGDMFIRALLMLVVPLVMVSMVVGICQLGDVRKLEGLGLWTVIYYAFTTALSVSVGIFLVNIIQPGWAESESERVFLRGGEILSEAQYQIDGNRLTLQDKKFRESFDDRYVVILMDQENVLGELAKETFAKVESLEVARWVNQEGEKVTPKSRGQGVKVDLTVARQVKGKERSIGSVLKEVVVGLIPENLFKSMAENDILPLIIFSLFFGAVLSTLGEKGATLVEFFDNLNTVIMNMVHVIMLTAPVGIGALIAGRLGEAGGFVGFWPELVRLGNYALTVICGLLIHALITIPLILYLVTGKKPLQYAKNMLTALTTAFSTASSSATLPMTMSCVSENNKVSRRSSSFVLPLGATINMDGTALYEAVAAIFIAQIYGIVLGPEHMVIIFLTATLAAIGAAGIPEAGLVTMVIVLQAVNLPVEGISLILVIDWFLDRCRTTINVWGDSVGAAVVEKLNKNAT